MRRFLILVLIWVLMTTSLVEGAEPALRYQVSQAEVEAVRNQIVQALGDSICDRSLEFIRGQSRHGESPAVSCFIEFSFVPPKLVSESVLLRFEHPSHNSWVLEKFKKIPDCATDPSLCDLNVTREQAIEIARYSGLAEDVSQYELQLVVTKRPYFYWQFLGKVIDEGGGRKTVQEFLHIDAVTGVPGEVMTSTTYSCGL